MHFVYLVRKLHQSVFFWSLVKLKSDYKYSLQNYIRYKDEGEEILDGFTT